MCYFEGCKKGILSIGKAKGLHVMAYRSDIGNALLLCSYLYSAEYVSVNMTHLLCEFVSFFSHIAFLTFTVLSSVILRGFCYYFTVVNVGTWACICPKVPVC